MLNFIVTRRVKYSFILLLIVSVCLAYCLGYQAKAGYFLHITTQANNLAVETATWKLNQIDQARKEAIFSVDGVMREHIIPLPKQKYSSFTINCSSPAGDKSTQCLVKNIYISDISGAKVFSLDGEKIINNTLTIPVYLGQGSISMLDCIYQFILHMLPVLLSLFILLVVGGKHKMALAIGFCIMYIYAMLVFSNTYTGVDAIENINVAKYLFSNHPYNSFVEYRGYTWFFILWLINCTANLFQIDFYYCYAIYGCIIFTLLLNYLLPNFAKKMGVTKINYLNIILLGFTMIILYGKQFFSPLPDIMPMFFLLLGLNLLLSISLPWKFLAGFCVAISCLMRENYYISVVFILLFIVLSMPRKFLTITLFLAPVLMLLVTNKIFPASSIDHTGMTQQMLFRGMKVQKSFYFEIQDMTGANILKQEQIDSSAQLTLKKYARLIKKYPFDFLAMYGIRLFNGLDIKSSQVYEISKPGQQIVFSIINYILIFFGLYYIYNYFYHASYRSRKLIYLLALTIPGLIMVQSYTEPRYFLPLLLVITSLGALSMNLATLKKKPFILGLIIFIVCCITISKSVYNQLV